MVGEFLQPVWCCSPKCCNAKLDERVSVIDTANEEFGATAYTVDSRKQANSWRWSLKVSYHRCFELHINRCVNCFVEGLGRTKSMCDDMGDSFLEDEPLIAVTRHVTNVGENRIRKSGGYDLLSLYKWIIAHSSGLQAVNTSSTQHFNAIRDYILQTRNTCVSGWPLLNPKWSDGPGTWRIIWNQVKDANGSGLPNLQLRSATPSPFEAVSRGATPHLEQASKTNETLTRKALAEFDGTVDQLEQILFGAGSFKYLRESISGESLSSQVAGHLAQLLDFEARNLTWLARIWNQRHKPQFRGASAQFMRDVQQKLRDSNEMLDFERKEVYKWIVNQPPLVKSEIGTSALILTTELDMALQDITGSPEIQKRATALFEERQQLQQNVIETEQEEGNMEDLQDGEDPQDVGFLRALDELISTNGLQSDGNDRLEDSEQLEQTLHGYYDSHRKGKTPIPYKPLQPKH